MQTESDGGTPLAPVRQSDRIGALDVLRGVAVLGILMMNIPFFGMPWAGNPSVVGGGMDRPNFLAWGIIEVFFEGTMRGIFSMLFGASLVLLTYRMERAGAGLKTADIFLRRTLWMMLFGLIHWTLLLWVGDILFLYSFGGLLLFVFRKVAPRKLAIAGAVMLVLSALMSTGNYYDTKDLKSRAEAAQVAKDAGKTLSKEQDKAVEDWKEATERYSPPKDKMDEDIKAHRGSYGATLSAQLPDAFKFQWIGLPFGLLIDCVPFMLIGMALLRWNVLGGKLHRNVYLGMMAGGYGIGLPLNIWEYQTYMGSGFDMIVGIRSGITYEITRFAMSIGHIGLILLAVKSGILKWLQHMLSAVGQMALSNYIGQTLICVTLFNGFGFDLFGRLQRHELYYVVFAVWIAQLLWSPLWLKHFRFGPLEWLWRSLTYWQRQPMLRQ